MQQFRREDVRAEQGLAGDALHERWFGRSARGQEVVLLRLRDEHAMREDVRGAWLDLAARNAACRSAGVLPVLDYGMHGGAAWLVREHAPDAITLAAVLDHLGARGEPMPVLLAVHVLRVLCAILGEAHVAVIDGYVRPLFHGDLCAEHVLVRADGHLQLAELGLHALVRAQGAGGDHVAPEAARGDGIDARADAYALGVLLKRMVVPGASKKSGGTRAIVPALPPHEIVLLITRLTAQGPNDRPPSMAAVQRELSIVATHGAGEAVLAQLHEDARTRQTPVPRVTPSSRVSGQKTAMFVTPLTAGSGARAAAPAREATGSFRGRTQVFGAPPTQAMTPLAPSGEPAPPPPTSLPVAPALLSPPSAPRAPHFADEPPPLLGTQDTATSDVRYPTHRLDMTGMPPMLAPAASARVVDDAPPPLRATSAPAHEVGGAARGLAPAMRATSVARLPARPREDPPMASAPPAPNEPDEPFSAVHQESGLRLAAAALAGGAEATPLPLPEPGPRIEVAARASRKREPWREASETVFKLKAPAAISQIAPRERLSPGMMFLIAMIVATALIVGIRLLVGMIA